MFVRMEIPELVSPERCGRQYIDRTLKTPTDELSELIRGFNKLLRNITDDLASRTGIRRYSEHSLHSELVDSVQCQSEFKLSHVEVGKLSLKFIR